MNRFDQTSAAHSGDSEDDLFDKLDQLITRHQGRPARPLADTPVPLLTEAVDAPAEPEIPVLDEAVDLPHALATAESPLSDKRRQLQVALYLRLRHQLDEALEAGLSSPSGSAHDGSAQSGSADGGIGSTRPDSAAARLAQELRNALPAIVRESVEQVFGVAPRSEKD